MRHRKSRILFCVTCLFLVKMYPGASAAQPQDSTVKAAILESLAQADIPIGVGEASEPQKVQEDTVKKATRQQDRSSLRKALSKAQRVWADTLRQRGQYEESITPYEEALNLARQLNDRTAEGVALNGLGSTYYRLRQYPQAIKHHTQALALFQAVQHQALEALALTDLGSAYYSLSQYLLAIVYHKQALTIFRKVQQRGGAALALTGLGLAYRRLGQYVQAIEDYTQALTIQQALLDRAAEGMTLYSLGSVYDSLGQYPQAIQHYTRALALSEEVQNHVWEALALVNLGWVYAALSQYPQAIERYKQALVLSRVTQDQSGETLALLNLGLAYSNTSRYPQAIDYYTQLLTVQRERRSREEGMALSGLGNVYGELRQYPQAIEYHTQALTIARQMDRPSAEWISLNNLGLAYSNTSRDPEAIQCYTQALAIAREVHDWEGEGTVLGNLGLTYFAAGLYPQAIEHYTRALARTGEQGKWKEGRTLYNLGWSYNAQGQYADALERYTQALTLLRGVQDRPAEGAVLNGLMLFWLSRDKPRLAIFYGKQAINVIQEIRGNIQSLDRELQRSFLRSERTSYRVLAEVLINEGRLPEALQILNLLKEEEFFEFVRRDRTEASSVDGRVALTPQEATWAERYRKMADQLPGLIQERRALARKKPRSAAEERQLGLLTAEINVATQAFRHFLNELRNEFGKAGREPILRVRKVETLQADLQELGPGVVVLYTLVSEETYYVIVTTPDTQVARKYPIGSTALNRKIADFRNKLRNRHLDPQLLAQELYDIVVGPIAADLKAAGAQTLVWELDSSLRYLPIAALHDGKQYMVERYRTVMFTPASHTLLKEPPSPTWRGLGLGVSKEHLDFAALPAVIPELNGIIREEDLQDDEGILAGRILLDGAFTEAAWVQALAEQYQAVHVATHFELNPKNEAQSFLLLGDGSSLSLERMRTLPGLTFEGVELLTLSACNTAMQEGRNGEEIEGFAVLAQRKGAKAVIATLTAVLDKSTQLLMETFYRIREDGKLRKAEALRQAQLRLLRGRLGDAAPKQERVGGNGPETDEAPRFKKDPQKPYAHPYYWAPFILIGNWL